MTKENDVKRLSQSLHESLPQTFSEEYSVLISRLIAEVELLRNFVKELAVHLGVSQEELRQVFDRASENLRKQKKDIAHYYFGEKNNK